MSSSTLAPVSSGPVAAPPVVLPAAPPFELALSLRALSGFAPCAGEQRVRGGSMYKALATAGGPVVAEVGPAPGGVSLVVHGEPAAVAAGRREAAVAVARWLSLADDPSAYLAVARRDPAMAPVLAETEGLHHVRFASVAEGACYFVLAQRTSQAQAGARKRRLAAAYGPAVELDGAVHRAFPRLERLAGLGAGELAGFTATQRQAEYLAALLEALADRPPEWGYTAPTGEVLAELRRVRGVGEFTATALALRVFGRLEVVPAALPAFTRAIDRLYGPGVSLAELAGRYGPAIGLWGYHVRTGMAWLDAGEAVSPARAGSSGRTAPSRRRAAPPSAPRPPAARASDR